MEEEAESSMVRKRLRHTNDDCGNGDPSNSPEEEPSEEELEEEETEEEEGEEMEEEVSSEETSMNQLDTSEEKLYARCAHDILVKDDGDNPSTLSEPLPTPESHRHSDEESSDDNDDDDDFWM
jgi:hypothetical protein